MGRHEYLNLWRETILKYCQKLSTKARETFTELNQWPPAFQFALVIIFCYLAGKYSLNMMLVVVLALTYLSEVARIQRRLLERSIRHQEKKSLSQRRLLSESESVRWLNGMVDKAWPIFIEEAISKKILPAVAPWFLTKYKPWQVKKAVLQSVFLGSSPPLILSARCVDSHGYDDNIVMELTTEFVASESMDAVISAQPRKRLGLGFWTKCQVSNLVLEGKVRVGVKLVPDWPYVSRMRISFTEAPYISLSVKPELNFGMDIAQMPGISAWIDKLLGNSLEDSMVDPNVLEIDVVALLANLGSPPVAPGKEPPLPAWQVRQMPPCATVSIQIMEAVNLCNAESNGASGTLNPFVKGTVGRSRFRTQTKNRTANPQWFESFQVSVTSWQMTNLLLLRVLHKEGLKSESLGYCVVDLNQVKCRDGSRHEFWESLRTAKTGRLRLAVTINPMEDARQPTIDVATCQRSSPLFPQDITLSPTSAPPESLPELKMAVKAILADSMRPHGVKTSSWSCPVSANVSPRASPARSSPAGSSSPVHRRFFKWRKSEAGSPSPEIDNGEDEMKHFCAEENDEENFEIKSSLGFPSAPQSPSRTELDMPAGTDDPGFRLFCDDKHSHDEVEAVGDLSYLKCVRPGQLSVADEWKVRKGGRQREAEAMTGYFDGVGSKNLIHEAVESMTGCGTQGLSPRKAMSALRKEDSRGERKAGSHKVLRSRSWWGKTGSVSPSKGEIAVDLLCTNGTDAEPNGEETNDSPVQGLHIDGNSSSSRRSDDSYS